MLNGATQQLRGLVLGTEVDDETEGIEVALVRHGDRSRLEGRLTRCGPGAGWYVEKRISLSPARSKMVRQSLGRSEALAWAWNGAEMASGKANNRHSRAHSSRYPETD